MDETIEEQWNTLKEDWVETKRVWREAWEPTLEWFGLT